MPNTKRQRTVPFRSKLVSEDKYTLCIHFVFILLFQVSPRIQYLNKHDSWEFNNTTPPSNSEKHRCMNCVRNSNKVNVVIKNMANLDDYFTSSYCDAIAANCGRNSDKLFFGNSHAHWEMTCSSPSNNIQTYLCYTLDNSVFQYFLGFLSPITCSMKIAAFKLKNEIKEGIHRITHKFEDLIHHVPGLG